MIRPATYRTLDNANVVADYANRDAIQAAYDAEGEALRVLRVELEAREKQHRVEQRRLDVLERVREICDGIAISWHSYDDDKSGRLQRYAVGAVGDDIKRSAEVYLSAHTQLDWGVRIFGHPGSPNGFDKFLGCGWPRLAAIQCARQWVIHKTEPTEPEIKFWREFHKRFPNATKLPSIDHQHAFEAAWIIGDHATAADILHHANEVSR